MSYKRQHSDVSNGGSETTALEQRRPSSKANALSARDEDEAMADDFQRPSIGRRVSRTDGAESDASSDQARSRKKAEPVKSACVQCQKRKTKCSGQRPICRFCSDRNLECSWDIGDGLTRTADLKQKLLEAKQGSDDLEQRLFEAKQRSDDLDTLVKAMRSESDETSTMLLAKLRMGASIVDLATGIRDPTPAGYAGIAELQPSGSYSQPLERTKPRRNSSHADLTSPTSLAHPLDWHGARSPFQQHSPMQQHCPMQRHSPRQQHSPIHPSPFQQQLQTNQGWTTNPNAGPSNSQSFDSFLSPEAVQVQMTWRRNNSLQSPEDHSRLHSRIPQLHPGSRKDSGPVPQVTLVPIRLDPVPTTPPGWAIPIPAPAT